MLSRRNNLIKTKRFGGNKFFYTKKSYKNPFFQRQRQRLIENRGLNNRIKLMIFAAALALIILIWLLFFSSLFKISKIEISGSFPGSAKEVEAAAWNVAGERFFGKNNLLVYNKNELKRILNEKYNLESLSIKKKLFHELKIVLEEKRTAAVWREDDKYYYLDGQGRTINQVDSLNISQASFPLIENLTGVKINERQANIEKDAIDFVISLFNEFRDKKYNFEIERFIVDQNVNTIKLAVLSGPQIYFNLKQGAGEQAARLNLIIKEKLKDNFKAKQYIDLRYGNNIYIK